MSKICPDISVIIPVYNVEEYLEECLESFKNQGDVSLEIIMIDDGSTDSSGEIADRYAEENENYSVYHIENGGLGHARNYAVTLAKGKYIFFVDSDDIIPENTLCNMFAISEINGCEMTICNVARFNSKKIWASGIHQTVFENFEYVTHISRKPELIFDTISCNKLILREFYLKHNFMFPENILYEDIPVTIPMHILANKVAMYNAVGYLWRVREGTSKSITQNTEDLKNLTDRIKIVKMLDKFFDENVSDKNLHIAKQIKVLKIDLNIFVRVCARIDREPALEMMKHINKYLDDAISDEAMNSVSIILRQKYAYIRAYNYDNLKEICSYESRGYSEAPVEKKDGRLTVTLKDELFTVNDRDISNEVKRYPIRRYIDSTEQTKTTFIIHGHAYKRRVSVSEEDLFEIKAYLCNIITGEKYQLPVEREKSEKLTRSVGTIADPLTGNVSSYNYDGVGFAATVDINELMESGCTEGQYKVILEYDSGYYCGTANLSGARRGTIAKGNSSLISGYNMLRVNFLYMQEICFTLTKDNVFSEEVRADEKGLILRLNTDNANVFARCGDDVIPFEHTGDSEFSCGISALKHDEDFYVFAVYKNKTVPVLSDSKRVSVFTVGEDHVVVSTLKTREYLFRIVDTFVKVKKYEVTDTTASITTLAEIVSGSMLSMCERAQLCVKDNIAGCDVVLGKGKCKITEEGNLKCKFFVDFSKNFVDNFYTSERLLFVKFFRENKAVCISPIYSKVNFKASFEFETLKVKFVRNRNGKIGTVIWSKWKESDNSSQKRKTIKLTKYPEFLKEPINRKRIVFESMWGTKYSCNVRALYEYIDKNYPEYECIWSFTDEKTPINGKGIRVRRGSEDYWHYLATAKYFVNNVNFENDYVKRKGQIHIQTMHGTPLKTLGLDVPGYFPTQQSIEQYLEKCNRWDYLITQGEFMKDKAYDCYKFDKKVLETGYPRTDMLFNVTQEEKNSIIRKLGLPEDKKIILYAPTWRTKNKFDMMLDLEKMKKRLSDEYILLVRIHHLCSSGYSVPDDGEFVFDLSKYSAIEDLYQISDILITDYSSVMFDYALLNKPMLFFVYDFDAYCGVLRGLYVDFKEEAPGSLLYTSDEVISAIENIEEETEKCHDKVSLFKEKYLTYENDSSSEKVVREVIKPSIIRHYAYKIKQKLK